MPSFPPLTYGLDIGGSKMELLALNATDAPVYRERVATPTQDFDAFIDAVAGLVERADAACSMRGAPSPLGVGMPGIVDVKSGRQVSSNVPALNGRAMLTALQTRLGRPVAMGNDCQCFALSEAQGGAATDAPTMFGAILGTGAGGGYCVGGRLLRGYNAVAGEWGHWGVPGHVLAEHGLPSLPCPCGLVGCLERYVSGAGMAALHGHLLAREGEPAPTAPLSAAAIFAAASAGDAAAMRTRATHLDVLAYGMAALIMGCDPHAIVIGGGLSKEPSIFARLPSAIQRHLFRGLHVPPILRPRFGDAGGARGAALLARQMAVAA